MMNGKSGQAALLVILLSLLGLTVGLGVISRSLSDIKQTTTTDSGSKALAAAEAMAQYAATQTDMPDPDCSSPTYHPYTPTPPFSGISSLNYAICDSAKTNVENTSVKPGELVYLSNLSILSDNVKKLAILWGRESAVEVTYLKEDNVLSRYAINGDGLTPTPSNNFSQPQYSNSAGTLSNCIDNTYCTNSSSYTSCQIITPGHNINKDILLRVRVLNTTTPIKICAFKNANGNGNGIDIGIQTVSYIGKAVATDGTVRRVQLTKTPSGPSGIFDYTLYTEGTLQK